MAREKQKELLIRNTTKIELLKDERLTMDSLHEARYDYVHRLFGEPQYVSMSPSSYTSLRFETKPWHYTSLDPLTVYGLEIRVDHNLIDDEWCIGREMVIIKKDQPGDNYGIY